MCAYRAACGQCIEHNLYLSVVSELGYEVAFATLEAIYVLGFMIFPPFYIVLMCAVCCAAHVC